MARNKMDREFSEKLNQREIKPSAAAWDRLDAMLAATEAQPKVVAIKKSYKWLYVAAGFLGFLFIGTLFFRQGATTNPEPNNIIANEKAEPKTQNQSVVDSVKTIAPKQEIASSEEIKSQQPSVKKVRNVIRSAEKQQQLADNAISQQSQDESIINQKTQLNQSVTATVQNADELLAAAQAKREESKNQVKVNARSLLQQVDSQAEEKLTPRQRALRALNRNYQHVKVAVENRNIDESH